MHPHRHLRPGLGSQRDLPVDPGGPAPGIALRHLPHADQRVGPAPQHQLLQVPDPGPVLLLRRREDPLPQPPYLLLLRPPVGLVPLGGRLRGAGPPVRSLWGPLSPRQRRGRPTGRPPRPGWRSCNPSSRLTCPSVPATSAALLHRLTCPRQRAFAPGHQARYPASYAAPPAGEPGMTTLVSCCLSAAGIRFLGILSRPGIPPLLRSAYRAAKRRGPERGFHVPHA